MVEPSLLIIFLDMKPTPEVIKGSLLFHESLDQSVWLL